MKYLMLIILVSLMSCSRYQVSISGDGKKVAYTQNKHLFGFTWGDIFICDVSKDNKLNNCKKDETEKVAKNTAVEKKKAKKKASPRAVKSGKDYQYTRP